MAQLDFEKPVLELEAKIAELQNMSGDAEFNIADEISRMRNKSQKLLSKPIQNYLPRKRYRWHATPSALILEIISQT